MVAFFYLVCAVGAGEGPAKSLRSLTAADSYQFTIQEGGPASSVSGKFQKDRPVYFLSDKFDFFRQGEVMVYQKDGKWQRTRTGTLSDPLIILGASSKVRSARLPHEELTTLEKAWIKVKAEEAKEMTVLHGELTEKGAKDLARTENRSVAQGGQAKVWLDGKGNVVKYEIAIRLQGRIGGAEVDGTFTKQVTVSGIGATRVDVPAEAKKALE